MAHPTRLALSAAAALALALASGGSSLAQTLPASDLTRAEEVRAWQPTHDVAPIEAVPEGMQVRITGGDPYITGPARDYPADTPLWLRIRLKSEQPGAIQVFYCPRGQAPAEERSVRFVVKEGEWVDAKMPLPALGPGARLRLDPPGTRGTCTFASVRFETRILVKEPAWPKPQHPALRGKVLSLSSGPLTVRQGEGLGFLVSVAGEEMAFELNRPLIGYTRAKQARWLDLARQARVKSSLVNGVLRTETVAQDADGGRWRLVRRFSRGQVPGSIDVETQISVSQEREISFLPMLVLLPGAGSFGETKNQGLFAGLEYLDKDEPSSSEADIRGPGARRQVPDTLKITFPLMAIQARERYVGLVWDTAPSFCALFDSPDRLFHSGGHVMGVLCPGSNGLDRPEGSLLPYNAELLEPGKPLSLRATLLGGKGSSVIPAVQQYVALRGLPELPDPGLDAAGYAALASQGWLDSKIREGDGFRHAYWPGGNWGPQQAGDAAIWMDWLACRTKEPAVAARLRESARATLAPIDPASYNASGVSHVRYPLGSLLYGHVAENAARAREAGRAALARFEADGSILYHKAPDRPDYGKTHFAPDSNGLTSQAVSSLLEQAAVSGDAQLIREGLRLLRALDKFSNTVPRGAQTWECPLHTPDILASAHLVRAYTLGYELTGERHFLDQALYWAWTGVPFVYLVNPTGQPVGPYATIAVLGATNWVAPNWMGMPVQWCGLVYSDALYRLARHDPNGPWKRLADGIALSGVQQTYPQQDAELKGLLPDSFNLRAQTRNGPAINPGTVQANAARLFGDRDTYDFRAFRQAGLLVHAPGSISPAREERGRASFRVRGWAPGPYYVLVSGCAGTPRVRLNGHDTPLSAPHQFLANDGWLILRVEGEPNVEIEVGKTAP